MLLSLPADSNAIKDLDSVYKSGKAFNISKFEENLIAPLPRMGNK